MPDHIEQKQCDGYGQVYPYPNAYVTCPGCDHADCPNRRETNFTPEPLPVTCRSVVDEWEAGMIDSSMAISLIRAALVSVPKAEQYESDEASQPSVEVSEEVVEQGMQAAGLPEEARHRLALALQAAAPAIAAKAVEEKEAELERWKKRALAAEGRSAKNIGCAEKAEQAVEGMRKQVQEAVDRGRENRDADLEHLGLVRCESCEEGVACGTDSERDPEGNLVPVPVREWCPDCDGTGWRNQRGDQAIQKERERLEKVLEARFDRLREVERHGDVLSRIEAEIIAALQEDYCG